MLRVGLCVLVLALGACNKSDAGANHELAQTMLRERGAPDFADASTEAFAAIRHEPSGMVCVLPPNGAFAFDVFPANAQNAGAQCSSTQDGVAVGWVAVRFSTPTTLDAVFSASVAQLAAGLEPEAWPGQVSAADLQSPQGLVHYRIQRLQAPVGGEMQFLRVAVAERDGWYLQQIVSAPIASAQEAETAAGEIWRQGLARFSAPNVSDAAAAG